VATWQEALVLLHERGWHGELVDEACTSILEACAGGDLDGRDVGDLAPDEVRHVLSEPVDDEEAEALLVLAEVHDRGDVEGERLRRALLDLDAFADGGFDDEDD
jgi:hypothetical protein